MSTPETPSTTPLATWLRGATTEQRERMALLAGTTVNYLYQLASCKREAKSGLAFAIESATTDMWHESDGSLPIVTARDIATMCAVEGL